MAFELPEAVLRKLLNIFRSNPLQLTETEQNIAKRVEICSACNAVWFRRAKKKPERCPRCHKRAWDRPFIAALEEAHRATHPNEPETPPPTPHARPGRPPKAVTP
jgi:predicted Zn-ribbon and HTH transcriptional regulator